MIHISSKAQFEEAIKGDFVFVDFYADWCGPCKMLDMVLEDVEKDRSDVTFVKVDTDRFLSIAKEYKVLSVPALFIFSHGEVKKEAKGFMRKEELLSFLEQ